MAVKYVQQRRRTLQQTIDHNNSIIFEVMLVPNRFKHLLPTIEEAWGADVETPLQNNHHVEAARASENLKWKASRLIAEVNIEGACQLLGQALEHESLDGDTYDARLAELKKAEEQIERDSEGASKLAVSIHRVTLGELYAKRNRDVAEAQRQAEEKAAQKRAKTVRCAANGIDRAAANKDRDARQKGKVRAA